MATQLFIEHHRMQIQTLMTIAVSVKHTLKQRLGRHSYATTMAPKIRVQGHVVIEHNRAHIQLDVGALANHEGVNAAEQVTPPDPEDIIAKVETGELEAHTKYIL